VLRDKECRGLALIVNPSAMTWVYSYSHVASMQPLDGALPQKRHHRNPESHSTDDARREAYRLKAMVAGGTDPAAERRATQQRRVASCRPQSTLGGRICEVVQGAKDAWNRRSIGAPISPTSCSTSAQHVATMKAWPKGCRRPRAGRPPRPSAGRRPTSCHRRHRFGAVSRFFDWCVEEQHLTVNPCLAVGKARRPKPAPARTRHLTPLKPPRCGSPWADRRARAPGLCPPRLAVPCRIGEAASIDWGNINFEAGT
jgi:integrase